MKSFYDAINDEQLHIHKQLPCFGWFYPWMSTSLSKAGLHQTGRFDVLQVVWLFFLFILERD